MQKGRAKVLASSAPASKRLLSLAVALLCAFGVTLGAKIKVPFWPVPFTMQTFAVAVLALMAGRRLALLSIVVFMVLCGPTSIYSSGYIVGFVVMAYMLSEKSKAVGIRLAIRIALAYLTNLTIGTAVLAGLVGIRPAITSGFLFFVPAEIFKGVLTFLLVNTWRRSAQKSRILQAER